MNKIFERYLCSSPLENFKYFLEKVAGISNKNAVFVNQFRNGEMDLLLFIIFTLFYVDFQ